MKVLRTLLLVFVGLVLVVALLVALAFVPAIQRSVALHFANQQPGLKIAADRIAIGLHGVNVQNLVLSKDGMVVSAPAADLRLSLVDAALHKKVWIESLVAKGWKVTLPTPAPASSPVAAATQPSGEPVSGLNPVNHPRLASVPASSKALPTSFAGVFKYLDLPVDVRVGSVDIAGDVIMPSAQKNARPSSVQFTISGGGFEPGSEAKFLFTASAEQVASESSVVRLSTSGTLLVRRDAAGVMDKINLVQDTEAKGENIPSSAKLRTNVSLARAEKGEHYDVAIDLTDSTGPQRLLSVSSDFKPGASLEGTWTIHASRDQIAPFAMGAKLPKFAVTGDGKFKIDPSNLDPEAINAQLNGTISQETGELETVMPQLSVLGPIKSEMEFDLSVVSGKPSLRKFDLTVRGAQPLVEAHLLQVVDFNPATKAATFEKPTAELLRLQIQGIPLAWVRPFLTGMDIQGDDLKGEFVIVPKGTGFVLKSTAPITLQHLSVTQGSQALVKQLDVSLATQVEYGEKGIHAEVTNLLLKTADHDSVIASADILVPAGVGSAMAIQASFDADFPKLISNFAPVGPLKAKGEIKAALKGTLVSVTLLTAELSDAQAHKLLELRARQPFSIVTAPFKISTDKPGADLAYISLGNVPLAMAKPFIPANLVVQGAVSQGEFEVRTEGTSVFLRTPTPLKIVGLGIAQDGTAMVSNVNLEVAPVVDYTSTGTKAEIPELKITTGSATILTLKTSAVIPTDIKAPKTVNLSVNVSVAALGTQPVMANLRNIAQGQIIGSVDATLGEKMDATAQFTLNGLTARDTGKLLPVVNAHVHATQNNGEAMLDASLLVDSAGRRSDVAVKAVAKQVAGEWNFDARMNGQQLVVDDLMLLAAAFTPATPAEKALPAATKPSATLAPRPATRSTSGGATPSVIQPDTKPAWAGVKGQAGLDIKSVVYGEKWNVTGIVAVLKVDPSRISLEKLAAHFAEKSDLAANALITFTAGAKLPYDLKASFNLQNFDTVPVFKAIDPNKPPTVEGVFNFKGAANGKGATLPNLGENTYGSADLASKEGVFRGLKFASTASKATQVAGTLLSLAGMRGGEEVDLVGKLAAYLGEIRYDQLTLHISRDEQLNIKLDDFNLIAPEIHLVGSGQVTHQPDVPILNQPLKMDMKLAARGSIEDVLNRGKQLAGTKDPLGYSDFREPFTVTGTAENPDTSQLKALLAKVAVGGVLDILGSRR